MTLLIIVVVVVWLAQRALAVQQAMRFRRQYSTLRRDGRSVAVGAAKAFGRRVYVALAADSSGVVVENMVFRGVTIFAGGRSDARLDGASVSDVAAGRLPEGVDDLLSAAATQAAGFLSTAKDRAAGAQTPVTARRNPDKRKVRATARA